MKDLLESLYSQILEDTMREAFQEILKEKNKNKKLNFRTAAYAIALKKLRKFHDAVGMDS